MKKTFLIITVLMSVVPAFAGTVNLSSYASLSAAVTAIGTTRTTLVLDVPATVPAGGLTIPRTLQLKTAMELITLNGNLAVNGPFEAGTHQIFTGGGTVTFGTGTVKEIYPEWWGAVGNGSTDCTDAINKAIQATLSMSNVQVTLNTYGYMTGGGTLKFNPGVYDVTSIDLSDYVDNGPTHSIKIIGSGRYSTFIRGTQTGAIVVDTIGRSNIAMEDLTITTLADATRGTATPQTGLLLARMTGGAQMSNYNTFTRVNINGNFSVACAVWIAAEVNRWDTGELVNSCSTNHYCSFFTSPNNTVANVTSTHGTILASSNTVNTISNVVFNASVNNATPVIFHQWAAYTFIGCGVSSTGTGSKLVTYINDASDGCATFRGPIRWIGTDWVTSGDTVHYFKHGGSVSVLRFKDILDEGGKFDFITTGNQYVINTDGTPSTLNNVVIESAGLGSSGSTLYIQVNNIYNCSFNIFDPYAAAVYVNVTGTNILSSLGEGCRSGTGSPLNTVNPDFPGQEYLDAATNVWWKAAASGGGTWYPISSLYRTGTVTPVNNVTPAFVGDEYLNTSTGVWWKAYSVTSPYWYPLY